MPLKLDCNDSERCCSGWLADGRLIADGLKVDISACLGCVPETIVSHGVPQVAAKDYLSATLVGLSAAVRAGAQATTAFAFSPMPMYRFDWDIRLVLTGVPRIERQGDQIVLPKLADQNAAAAALLDAGELLFRAILHRTTTRTILPENRGCASVSLVSFTAIEAGREAFAGQAGWLAKIAYQAPANARGPMS